MKPLIVYATYYESTEKCSYKIKEKIQNAVMLNASISNDIKFMNDYDTIIIGTPIHIGKIHKNIKKFVHKYEKDLQVKKIFLFYCGIVDEYLANIEEQFPESIRKNIVFKTFLGGEIKKSKLKGIEKMGVEMIEKQMKTDFTDYNSINNEKIEELIQKITE
jgi:menaquinone-dependent protoporphyrinogen oxidase